MREYKKTRLINNQFCFSRIPGISHPTLPLLRKIWGTSSLDFRTTTYKIESDAGQCVERLSDS